LFCVSYRKGRRLDKGVRWDELAPLLEAAEKAKAKPVLAVAEKRGRVKMIDVERRIDFRA